MRVYIVQYKLVSDGMVCVPEVYDSRRQAEEQAKKIASLSSVYTGVRIASILLPRYTERMGTVPVEVENTF